MSSRQRSILIWGSIALAIALIWVPYTATLDLGNFAVSASAGYETIFSRPSNWVCAQAIIDQTHAFDFNAIQPRCQVGIDTARLMMTLGAIFALTVAGFLIAEGRREPQE